MPYRTIKGCYTSPKSPKTPWKYPHAFLVKNNILEPFTILKALNNESFIHWKKAIEIELHFLRKIRHGHHLTSQ